MRIIESWKGIIFLETQKSFRLCYYRKPIKGFQGLENLLFDFKNPQMVSESLSETDLSFQLSETFSIGFPQDGNFLVYEHYFIENNHAKKKKIQKPLVNV